MDWQKYFVQGVEIVFLGLGTYYDVKGGKIPVILFVFFGFLALLCNCFWRYQTWLSFLSGSLLGLLFLGIGWMTREALGYGDGLAILVLGMFEGLKGICVIGFAAFFLSGIYGAFRLIFLKEPREGTILFYPFLFTALLGVMAV